MNKLCEELNKNVQLKNEENPPKNAQINEMQKERKNCKLYNEYVPYISIQHIFEMQK